MERYSSGKRSRRRARGVTIVEMAIVLVIFGLLLGGILKGAELVNNARVKKVAQGASSIRVAYDSFVRRYQAIPGDFRQAAAYLPGSLATAGVSTANDDALNGNGNGRVEPFGTGSIDNESSLAFHHLVRARFLNCPTCVGLVGVEPKSDTSMTNVFGGVMSIYSSTRDFYERIDLGIPDDYSKIIAHLGGNIPVAVMAEVDRKIDDGVPHTGVVRAALLDERGRGGLGGEANFDYDCVRIVPAGSTLPIPLRQSEVPAGNGSVWYVRGDAGNCAGALIL